MRTVASDGKAYACEDRLDVADETVVIRADVTSRDENGDDEKPHEYFLFHPFASFPLSASVYHSWRILSRDKNEHKKPLHAGEVVV